MRMKSIDDYPQGKEKERITKKRKEEIMDPLRYRDKAAKVNGRDYSERCNTFHSIFVICRETGASFPANHRP